MPIPPSRRAPKSPLSPEDKQFDEESVTSIALPVEHDMRGLVPLLANLGGDELDEIEETSLMPSMGGSAAPNVLSAEPAALALPPDAPLPSTLHATLEVIAGPAKGETFSLTRVVTSIGRGAAGAVSIKDSALSRRHASVIFVGDDHFRVRDDGGINGTYLNGSKVVEYPVRDGDTLLLGKTMLLFRAHHD